MIEVLKQMQKALKEYHYYVIEAGLPNQTMLNKGYTAYQAGLKAIKELESQEPVGWHLIEALYPQGERLDIRMGDGSILCNLLPQADGDLWWDGSGTGEKFIDPVYADVTHWRIHSNTHPPQRTEQEPVQVSPLEFVEMVMEKEHLVGKPILWAEWPNQEKNT